MTGGRPAMMASSAERSRWWPAGPMRARLATSAGSSPSSRSSSPDRAGLKVRVEGRGQPFVLGRLDAEHAGLPGNLHKVPGPGRHHDQPSAGTEHPGELRAFRGAKTTVTTSTASSATGSGCQTSLTRFTASGFNLAARRSANLEISSPMADAGTVRQQPLQVMSGSRTGVEHRGLRPLQGGRCKPGDRVGKGLVVAPGKEIEPGRHHVGAIRFEDGSLAHQEVEVALPGGIKAVTLRAGQAVRAVPA